MATSSLSLLLISSCIISVLLQAASASKTRHFKWEVGYIYASPDCNEKILIGINGQFPGPTIRAKAGDTIHVELKNTLHTEGVVIHWHGIRQVFKGFCARTKTRNPVGADVHAWFYLSYLCVFGSSERRGPMEPLPSHSAPSIPKKLSFTDLELKR